MNFRQIRQNGDRKGVEGLLPAIPNFRCGGCVLEPAYSLRKAMRRLSLRRDYPSDHQRARKDLVYNPDASLSAIARVLCNLKLYKGHSTRLMSGGIWRGLMTHILYQWVSEY